MLSSVIIVDEKVIHLVEHQLTYCFIENVKSKLLVRNHFSIYKRMTLSLLLKFDISISIYELLLMNLN